MRSSKEALMTHGINAYPRLGYWDRQKERIEEARRLHEGARAVREARRAARAARAHLTAGASSLTRTRATNDTARVPPRAGSGRGAGALRKPLPVWRTAAARMGSSLVAVGERLERLALRHN